MSRYQDRQDSLLRMTLKVAPQPRLWMAASLSMMRLSFALQGPALEVVSLVPEAAARPVVQTRSRPAPETPRQPHLRIADGANGFSCIAPKTPVHQMMPLGPFGMYRSIPLVKPLFPALSRCSEPRRMYD